MYINYFGLKEKPFSIAPDPRYLYMSELHREALAHLLYGISSDGCFILLTGDVGTGKTTVCRCLLAQLPENTEIALVLNPRLTVLELLETICDELQIPIDAGAQSAKSYIDRLNLYLLEAHSQGKNVALLIDEAQNLSLDLLEQIRLLTNLETDRKKLLKIVLLGQTELREILEQPGVAQVSQRITSRFHLLPLDRENSFNYVLHRLMVAGEREKVFSRAALARIFQLTHGIPRLINVLCDRALLGAYVEEKYLVSSEIVDKAAQEVMGSVASEKVALTPKQLWLRLVSIVALSLLGVGGVWYYLNERSAEWNGPVEYSEPVVVPEPIGSVPEQVEPTAPAVQEEKAVIAEPGQDELDWEDPLIRIDPLEITE